MRLLLFGGVLLSLCTSAWASFPSLSYDTVTAGTISEAAQVNTYTFSANANDILDFTLLTTSGSLLPCIQIYSGGAPVAEGSSCPGNGDVELNGLQISSAGTYTVTINDYYSSNTGNYDIFLQRTDGPVGSVPLPLDQVQTGNIASATQSIAYTFSANANDVFNFTLVATNGNLLPCIQIYNSAGTKVTNGGSCPGNGDVELNGVTVSSAGTYSVIIKDYYDSQTGNYNLFLQRTDGPPNPINLPYDTVTAGTITAAAQTVNYTFAANANDILNFTLLTTNSTSGSLLPCIQIYYPGGAPVAGGSSCPGNGDVELNGLQISLAGTYTASIKDYYDTDTGDFNIFLQRTDGPVGSVPLPLDQVQTGNIASATQSNAYTFSANANDVFNFTLVATSGNLLPCIQIYNSAGTKVTNGGSCPGNGDVELNGVTVSSAGTYSVIIKDYYDSQTGNYNLFLQRTNDPANPVNIDFDQTMTGAISAVTQSNTYTFEGTATDSLNFTVTATSGNLLPCIQIYGSSGTPVPGGGTCPGNGTIRLNGFTVPSTGTYFLILKDFYDTGHGDYNISVQCMGTCLLPAPTLASISPTNVLAGSGGLTLTVAGSNFVNNESNSVIRWNGVDLLTTWASLNQMTAAVPGTNTTTAGIFPITVFTPAPGGGTSNSINFTVNNPVPTTTSISPSSATVGAATFKLTVNGTNFVASSQVMWNGNSLAIVSQTATQLQATVPASDCTVGGTDTVTVFDPMPGGGTSNSQTFTCNNPTPSATSLSPTSGAALGAAFTLTVNGSNFVQSSTVNWNGSGLATTFMSASELQAAVPAADLASPTTAEVTVTNPTPGGGTSSPSLPFAVEAEQSALASPAPGSTLASPSVTFTWTASYGATWYELWLGSTGVGSKNLLASGEKTGTSFTATGLPINGETIYARLFTYNGTLKSTDYTYTAVTGSMLTSPTPGSTFAGPSITFTWTAAAGPNWNEIWLGSTGVGSKNVWSSGQHAGTSVTATGLPINGDTLYARLFTDFGGALGYFDYTYTAATGSVLTSPAPGITLTSSGVTFTWTAATGANWNEIWLGSTGVGSKNVWISGQQSGNSITATGLPSNGEKLYARLFTDFGGALGYFDYTYTAVTESALTSPVPGSTLTSSSETFTWTTVPGASWYEFWLGTTGEGSKDLHSTGQTSATSVTLNNLPTNGEKIYARIYTDLNGSFGYNDYTYTAVGESALTSPAPGSTLAGPSVTFSWAPLTGASWYELWLGSTGVGSKNLYVSGEQTGTSVTVGGLPINGESIKARLFTYFNGILTSVDYSYTAATGSALTTPAPGSTFTGSSVQFTWTAVNGASWYELWLGSTGVGTKDLYSSGQTTATSATVNGLPTSGETVYARLYTYFNGALGYIDLTYTAQ